jgi:senataxin
MLSRDAFMLQPFTVLDLDSKEERGGTSLSNSTEAHLAVHLYTSLRNLTLGLSAQSRVAVITPYAQQAGLLKRCFGDLLGKDYEKFVEVNTVDAFQGREAKIVIFSAVRAAGSRGIGFLSDVRRMNVALTRAKNFLFVIARCQSIVVNPYWNDLVQHARETNAVVKVPILGGSAKKPSFGNPTEWQLETPTRRAPPLPAPSDPRKREQEQKGADSRKRKQEPARSDPRKREQGPKPADPRKPSDQRNKELDSPSDPRKRRRTDTNDCPI